MSLEHRKAGINNVLIFGGILFIIAAVIVVSIILLEKYTNVDLINF